MSIRPLDSLPPTETLDLENGLSLVPCVRLSLTIFPASPAVTKLTDQWKLKRTLIHFLKTSLSVPVVVSEEDLRIRRVRVLKNRKRGDPLALGALVVRDLGIAFGTRDKFSDGEDDPSVMEKKFLDWRSYLVEKLDGIELNIEGLKFQLNVEVPISDDFEAMKVDWEEFYASRSRGYSRSAKQEPDTIVLRGVPSRWFAEPRVSSKPSLLVTHTIFSTFGRIRNLNVAEDNDLLSDVGEDGADIIPGLHCKIVAQFETHAEFYNTLKVLCCRSMQKQGSRLLADYEVTWDKDGFFQNLPGQTLERRGMRETAPAHYRSEVSKSQRVSRLSPDDAPRKRFKE